MVEFDEEDFLLWQDCAEVPVIYMMWLHVLLLHYGFDYVVGEA